MKEWLIALLGLGFGAVAALSILLANVIALKFNRGNALLDLAIRLGCYGVVMLLAAEIIGTLVGSEVRRYAPWFWSGAIVAFISIPFFTVLSRRRRGKR